MRRKDVRKTYTFRQHVMEYFGDSKRSKLIKIYDIPLEKDFVKELKFLRKSQGITQEKLAQKSGVSKTYISRIENRLVSPTLFIIDKLTKALGFRAKILFKNADK